MKILPVLLAAIMLPACAPAPIRPAQQPQTLQVALDAALAKEREARRQAEVERARAERELAELKRRHSEARQPLAAKISPSQSIAAQPLEPTPAPALEPTPAPALEPTPAPAPERAPADAPKAAAQAPVEPARIDPAALAWQLSTDLRRLHSRADVQTFYSERGWVVSLAAETLFEPGETSIRPGAHDALDSLARVLRHYAARGIVMEGPHAERAQAVKRALTDRGIAERGITAGGTGERIEFLVPHARLNAGTGR